MEDAELIGSVVSNADFVGMTYALKMIGTFAKDGWTAIVPEIQFLINAVVRLSLVLTFTIWVMKPGPDAIAEFFWVVIKLNVVLWMINDFWDITSMIFDGMVATGIATAPEVAGLATSEVLKDPGRIAGLGMVALTPLMNHIDSMLGPIDIFWYATELIFLYAALITGVAVFLVFGLLIFLASAEFYAMAIPAAFMAPFIAWNKTAFIATPAIAYVVNSGLRLLATTITVVMGLAIMLAYKWPEEATVQDAVNILILTIAILGAGLAVFKRMSGLVTGGPVSDVGSAIGSLYYAARLGSAAGKEVQDVAGGLRSGNGPLPRALSGFVNGVRGGSGPGGVPGASGAANTNSPGGVRGAFQRGLAGARANVAAGAVAGGGSNSSWYLQPTGPQMALASRNGIDLSGLNRAQATVALEQAGFGQRLNTGSVSGVAAAGGYGTYGGATGSGHASPASSSQHSVPPHSTQASTASTSTHQSSSGGGATQHARQATPSASGGSLVTFKQDMRNQQAYYDSMANDPALGPALADSLRRDANRDLAIQAAEYAGLTDPAKEQAMFDQISRVDGRVDRAIQAGRPGDIINQKSSAEYRDIVLNA